MKFKVILYQSDEGYAVKCPTLPGCWSQGDTMQEALANIQIGIREFLEAIWGEINQDLADNTAKYGNLKVTLDEVEVDLEGVENTQTQAIEAAV